MRQNQTSKLEWIQFGGFRNFEVELFPKLDLVLELNVVPFEKIIEL